jgi:excisionase family DNA binding protein
VEGERLLTVREAAERLRTTEETIRRWLRSGHLRGVRPGGTRLGWRIPESELRRIIALGTTTEGAL